MGVDSLAQIAQMAGGVDPVEIVGGSILAAVGVVALRMVMNAARHERDGSHALEDRLLRRIDQLEQDLADERTRSARLIVAYDRERQLRIALEGAGLVEHRHPQNEADELISPLDRSDLAEEIDASQ